ncbi:hypothetical protein HYH03_017808 [Edaphochlamys debaryana]|uniref:Mediator of RNA polymerase II transcription subunit 13 n=1 Tax=Edaphochlamys debaryana TaxID=47281 RepID=A0A835XLQ9_9CHLO|nr:hypothetical protein HYH03_017808 [Edaphochlamys debaryana]|eukprot:KAG2483305.1 hypothetical protein HYH03_017808 [Edaphochlamys debaryana]
MEAPAALVGFEGDWLAVQPSALPHWDKLSLEPYGPTKAAEFHVLCPEQHASAARMFAKDITAAFTALQLGSHTPARTPSHLHAIDGVIPVPLDPGQGPPQPAGPSGTEDATGGAGVPSWLPFARRPDRMVVRSAILGFRSNHAPSSVGSEGGWEPQEPCFRPRQPEAARCPASCPQAQPPSQAQPSQNLNFWRNLRHVGRQLQRHLLLPQQPVPRPGGGPSVATASGASLGAGSDAGEVLGLAPTSLVVYVVPPTESPGDVARALLEVAACLGPATPSARGQQARPPCGMDRPGPGQARREGVTAERGASSPPELPAPCSAGSTCGYAEQGGWAADVEDSAILARLGGAAKHLYRCSSGFAAAQLSPQLDLPGSPATEVTLQASLLLVSA